MIETTTSVNIGWHPANLGFNDGYFFAGYID
jgi:hypothetical protein